MGDDSTKGTAQGKKTKLPRGGEGYADVKWAGLYQLGVVRLEIRPGDLWDLTLPEFWLIYAAKIPDDDDSGRTALTEDQIDRLNALLDDED